MDRRALASCSLLLVASGCGTARISVPLVPPLAAPPASPRLWIEPFDALHPEQWREVEVRGRTQYEVVDLEGRRCLKAESRAGASILLHEVRFKPQTYERLSWRWRVDRLVEGEALDRKDGSDAAARVYVYFESAGLPWQKRNIDYVWSASLPAGTILSSAFSSTSKIIVIDSGASHLGRWRSVERDIGADYRQCFGETPPRVMAIGLMSDTDNTHGHALAYFDDVEVRRGLAGSAIMNTETAP